MVGAINQHCFVPILSSLHEAYFSETEIIRIVENCRLSAIKNKEN